jgi:methionine-rich copper-binding protein CopC
LAGLFFLVTEAAAQVFVLREPALLANGAFQVVIESPAPDSYLVLRRGDTPERITMPVTLSLPQARTLLADVEAGSAARRFYRVEAVPFGAPRDLDGDGLDDLFELSYPRAFHPLNPADAAGDFDGDGFANFEEYRRKTDPTNPADRPLLRISTTPAAGETGVSVHREITVLFEKPVAMNTELSGERFSLEFGGRRILARTELASDRLRAWLFPLEPLPPGARVQVVFDAAGIRDDLGREVDADGDGRAGGRLEFSYTTFGATPLLGTAVIGQVFDSEPQADGAGGFTNRPLAGVIITVDGAEQTLRTTTDATGFFRLDPAPAGRFFVHVDGRNAVGSTWPGGTYYPFIGKAWEASPGRTNNLAGGTGIIYLPRIVAETLQPVSATTDTEITFPPAVLAQHPALAGVTITVPANALFADNGTRGGRVGIAPVPPDRLPEPLPGGLALPLVITIQTDGPSNFDRPVPVRFPNLPDPITGQLLPPGGQSLLWSFDHDTGRWEPQGPMTVSDDGRFVETDPGVGVRQPGWHGAMPGSFSDEGGGGQCFEGGGSALTLAKHGRIGLQAGGCGSCGAALGVAMIDSIFCAISVVLLPVELTPGVGCGVTLLLGSLQASLDCVIAPADCRSAIFRPIIGGINSTALGCIPLVGGLVATPVTCLGAAVSIGGAVSCFASPGGSLRGLADASVTRLQPQASAPMLEGNFVQAQLDLMILADQVLLAWLGDATWLDNDPVNRSRLHALWEALSAANAPDSADGPLLAASEADAIRQLPRPSGTTELDMANLLSRFQRFFALNMTAAERDAILAASLALRDKLLELQALGWTSTADGITTKPAEFSRRISDEIPRDNLYPKTRYLLRNVRSGFELRGETTELGEIAGPEFRVNPATGERLPPRVVPASPALRRQSTPGGAQPLPPPPPERDGPILAPNSLYVGYFLDSATLRVGGVIFKSAPNGQTTHIPRALLADLPLPDADSDELSDLAEEILGTNPHNPDTDGDGVPDGVEVRGGSSPVGDNPLPQGLVAALDTDGEAADLAAHERYTVVADSAGGLAVVEVDGLDLTRVAVVPASGLVRAVAVDGHWAVGGDQRGMLTVLDLSRTTVELGEPRARITAGAPVWGVAVANPVAFVGLDNGQLLAVNLEIGLILDRLVVSAQKVEDVVVAGRKVAALAGATLHLFDWDGVMLRRLGSSPSTGLNLTPFGGRNRLFTDGQRVFATHAGGFNVFGVTGSGPTPLKRTETGQRDWKHLVSPDGARGIGAMGLNVGIHPADDHVSLYDLGAPAGADGFLATFPTPGVARAVLSRQGLIHIADHQAGLQVLNLNLPDRTGVAPTVTIHLASGTNTTEPNQWVELVAEAADNVAVREVDFIVNGTRVYTDTSFPFRHRLRSPNAGLPFVVAARAVDIGGNATLSAPLTLTVLADITPPRLVQTSPAPGAAVGALHEIVALFSERLHPATVSSNSVTVRGAGPDNLFDTDDDTLPTAATQTLRQVSEALVVSLAAPLAPGRYRLEISPTLADLAGHSITGLFAPVFRVAGPSDMTDTDRDGLPDAWEIEVSGTDAFKADTNGNGIPDGNEDLDGDRLTTLFELIAGTDPTKADTFQTGRSDAELDLDGDALTLLQEMLLGTDPTLADTDEDGWNDETEITLGSRPTDPRSLPWIFAFAPARADLTRPAWDSGAGQFAAPQPVSLSRPAFDLAQAGGGTFRGQPPLTLKRNEP